MNTINNFTTEDRFLFSDAWKCWWCESNQADSLHHIVGRGSKNGDVESSPLNAAPICNHKCHLHKHGLLMTKKWKKKLLKQTFDFLINSNYIFTKKDFAFIDKYVDFY